MDIPLLSTKFYIPPVRPEWVTRPHLIEKLNTGLQCKLTLISAPAGFGKTTLVIEWLNSSVWSTEDEESEDARVPSPTSYSKFPTPKAAWLSLDPDDNDPVRFVSYLIAALETIQADIGADAETLLQAPQPPPLKTVLTLLINNLNAVFSSVSALQPAQNLGRRLILVLDDYHVIEQGAVHEALTFLLEHLPPQLHLVVITRADPPLPLARLRTSNQLNELRAADLRFTLAEAMTFLTQTMELDLSSEDIATLEARTEGWIAGLQLAALSIRGKPVRRIDDFIAAFSGSHWHIIDYLAEEVMNQQPDEVHDFLCQTAVLTHLTAPLCQAVTGREDSELILKQLEQANLFLIPLDDQRQWYRYHRLFADFLRSHLHQEFPDQVSNLHRRASEWYEHQAAFSKDSGFMTAAINHALSGGDSERAASLIEQVMEPTLMRSEVVTFMKWVEALPDKMKRARPLLYVYYTGLQLLAGQPPEAIEAQLQQIIETDTTAGAVTGVVAAFQALIAAYRVDTRRSVELAHRALKLLPDNSLFLRSFIPGFLGLNYLYQGNIAAARRVLTEAATVGHKAGNLMITVLALCHLAELSMLQAKLHKAKTVYEEALNLAIDDEGRPRPIAGMALMGLGRLLQEWNDLESATRYLLEGIELIEKWADIGSMQGYVTLAQVKQAQGDSAGASEAMHTARQLAKKFDAMEMDDILMDTYQTRLWLTQGNLEAALEWVKERGLDTEAGLAELEQAAHDGRLSLLRTFEYIELAHVYIAQKRPAKALPILKVLFQVADTAGWTVLVIEILVLQALALQIQGDMTQAMIPLERALSLAEPEGFIRIFIDMGAPLAHLLGQAVSRRMWPEYTRKLLAVFEADYADADSEIFSYPPQLLIEPLTEREIEVLRLIAAGLSNQEVAEQLAVAVSTVKSHLNRVYSKLNVSSRTQAIVQARELNLL